MFSRHSSHFFFPLDRASLGFFESDRRANVVLSPFSAFEGGSFGFFFPKVR